jgi:predicted PP-loop superfamily ATPase
MSRIYRSLPPKGTKLGIAFSGGLDTRCAVAWLSRQGMQVYAYTADLAQPDEKDPKEILPVAEQHGAVVARLVDSREALAREGIVALRRLPPGHCRAQVLQHHAPRSRGDRHGHRARHDGRRRERVR